MMDVFRVRLNCIDHYQAAPTRYDPQLRNDIKPFDIKKGPKVPVIRVFGSTETGQKVCAHMHGAFPYLFVEYTGKLDEDEVGAYIYRLHLSIDHALAVSYRRDQFSDNVKYVARITLVKGVPFYGFHVGYKFYLKIYMFNPIVMTRLADLLQQGVIMKRIFQPYEAHLQFLLQFMTDFNLYGCAYLDASKVFFRGPIPSQAAEENSQHLWHDRSIPAKLVTDDMSLPRVSHCSIEVDISVQDILNRKTVRERRLHHDFVERKHPLPNDMKLVDSMAGLWKDETRRRKLKMQNPAQGSSPFPAEVLVSMSADPRRAPSQGWIHEEEYREEIERLIEAEKPAQNQPCPGFDDFVREDPWSSSVQTALEAVEDLFPEKLASVLGLPAPVSKLGPDPASSIEVDEQRIFDADLDSGPFLRDSDEEVTPQPDPAAQANMINAGPGARSKPEMAVPRAGPKQKATVNGLTYHPALTKYAGVAVSRVKSGNRPNIPFYEDLLHAADERGLTSRIRGDAPGSVSVPSLKRAASLPLAKDESKRTRLGMASHPDLDAINRRLWTDELGIEASRQLPPSQPKKVEVLAPPSSGGKNQTLNFPISKSQESPHKMPSTREEMPVGVQQGTSQTGDKNPRLKNLSFDPVVQILGEPNDSPLKTGITATESEPDLPKMLSKARAAVQAFSSQNQIIIGGLPPLRADVYSSLGTDQATPVIYQDAYYSDDKDVPPRPREYAGREFRLQSHACDFLPSFDPSGQSLASRGLEDEDDAADGHEQFDIHDYKLCSFKDWEVARPPPTPQEVAEWCQKRQAKAKHALALASPSPSKPLHSPGHQRFFSQIDGPSPRNKHGFKYSQKMKSTSVKHEAQYMSTMSLEVHVNSRGKLVPNPEEDEVQCVFWSIKADGTASTSQGQPGDILAGIIVLSPDGRLAERIRKQTGVEIIEEQDELAMMVQMVDIVRAHDPDILTGYEVHGSSWGYLIERARLKYDFDLCDEFSRVKSNSHGRIGKDNDRWGFNTTSTIRVTGRHMINIWRAMRGELNLLQYTMENVVWHLLHRRIPHYSWRTLTGWYQGARQRDLSKLLRYYLTRTRLDIELLEANELIPRTSEQARLLGVDFFSVFSRGSQFKVESIMFRIAKPENFILVSPSRKQVGGQNALECLPLVMEPQSAFYSSPLIVLDFQSLYPSVMIAYNLCYSTFLGRIVNWRGMNKMGFTEYKRHERLLELLKDHINITPNGMMYVKTEVRKSLLAKMLTEILETRVMVKSGMKQDKDDKTLQQLLNNRQLALKLLANVTYGYTSASFSGRMPCSEIADSIVQTGRETLERAIAFIHSQERWGAEVVYGDTDSLFIYLKGRTRDQAFDLGNEIAKAITDMNPRPIKLKFEKVYHPCVLLAKKRYVGYKYESRDQIVPEFDAKGIETVRRDGTPAEQKIEEKALRLLFETADLSQIKSYFQSQCEKIMRGAVSVQDFCFAREVRLGSYSDKGPPPPGALISTKRMLEDARAEPQYGERVPYVVVTGAPGARLIDRCVAPEDLLNDSHAQLDAEYYISKNLIPPLERIFNLVGANVRQWYDEMPKVQRIRRLEHNPAEGAAMAQANPGGLGALRKTLESYMKSASCIVCDVKMNDEGTLCAECRCDVPGSVLALETRLRSEEKRYQDIMRLCRTCAGMPQLDEVPCDSKDCPVFYSRVKQKTKVGMERSIIEPVIKELGAEAAMAALEW
ncbi:DNA polymerase family B [Plectosphaerella cucumerina]|uniref:DNA polymerase n=1 Tax=Plectosphaerella cucumerina TaxID=40658 RepID=A0A8K0X1E2_9PEZI|nr:DNA polymerase family B [Plectosphaerella cucumerina]